jgi:hypothetical protein
MKRGVYIALVVLIIFFLKSNCYALDTGIYWGTWKTKKGQPEITIIIESDTKASLLINKKFISNVEINFPYCQSVGLPFLCLSSSGEDYEHHVYVVIGLYGYSKTLNYDCLRGFYELEKIVGTEKDRFVSTYYPIELFKVKRVKSK